ncbi:hypothetical protein [Sorangium cellulosum]|uniref:hypothetical protein n=1 Tax=Sorangium cellulosum TaxID=56 RepID=UPI00133180BD|nr:hypothetical protein [Sorangium cellulosum]
MIPVMMVLLACGSEADPPANDQATSSATGAGGSGGGAATGASTSASSSASSGGAGSGGAGGAGGAGGSGGEDPRAAAASIDGFRWELPCDQDPGDHDECSTSARVDETRTFGGSPDTTYQVTVRLRGVVEPMTYQGGTSDGMHFRVGGSPTDPSYNIYSFAVSDPPEVYYLNDNPNVGHDTFIIDHTKTIPIRGGATVTFVGDGQNGIEIANYKHLVVDGIPPAPEPFIGQFIQLDVLSVEAAQP